MNLLSNRNAVAWVLLASAVALHVWDEALTHFLPFYNGLVESLRERLGFFPLPTFSFKLWLGGLIVGVGAGYALTPIVARGGRIIRIVTIVLGILMVSNALGHLLGSVYFGRLLPGVWSSPVLLTAAIYVLVRGIRGDWQSSSPRS